MRRGVLGAMAGLLAAVVGAAQTLPIRVAGLDAEGGLQVEYRSDADSYFILHRLPSLRGPRQPVALRLGAEGNSTLRGPRAATADSAFFQVERRRRIDPTDVDGDGLDDVYELGRPAILNPLDPADATRDPDGDGVSTLTEWRQGTDPEVGERRPTRAEFSPSPGSGGVSVRRETVVRFSRPLSEATRLDTNVFFAEVAGFSEILGSWCVILGFFTPIGALALAGTMGVAAYHHILTSGFNIYVLELVVLYLGGSLALLLLGPGRYSFDAGLVSGLLEEPMVPGDSPDLRKAETSDYGLMGEGA